MFTSMKVESNKKETIINAFVTEIKEKKSTIEKIRGNESQKQFH